MPQTGLCTDLTCDKEIKQLYECHCCSGLICFNHLTEHIEITKRNKERLDNLNHELITIIAMFKIVIEKKLLVIEHEKKLIEQAEKLLDVRSCSIDEMQNSFQKINQAFASNPIESIIKVESSLLDMEAFSIYKCDVNEENDQSSAKTIHSESKSPPICLDLPDDIDEVEKSIMSNNNEGSMCADDEFTDNTLLLRDQTIASMKDERKKQKEKTIFIGLCPLTFDGAYGLTKEKHSIHLCSNNTLPGKGLYSHFIFKHKFKKIDAQRLVQAVANDQDPITTKLFRRDAGVIKDSRTMSCPFDNEILDISRYTKKIITKVPCGLQSATVRQLKVHLKRYHDIPVSAAAKIVNHCVRIQKKHGVTSV